MTPTDIETCKKMKFEFTIPKNLGSKSADTKINELEEDEDEEQSEEAFSSRATVTSRKVLNSYTFDVSSFETVDAGA